MIQPSQYLWGVILVKQTMITNKREMIEKKEHKLTETLLYLKVRKQNKNLAIITIKQNCTVTIKSLFIFKSQKFVVFVFKTTFKRDKMNIMNIIYDNIFNLHHHVVMPPVWISLTLSRHSSLSFIASGSSSGLHPVSSQSCCM